MKRIITIILLVIPFLSFSQKKSNWFLRNSVGVSLDGKGDLVGPSFTNAIQYQWIKKHSSQLQHEFFSLKSDDSGLFKYRRTNSFQFLYGYNTSTEKNYHFEILAGGQIKFHEWRLSSNGPGAVIGTKKGLLVVSPNTTVIYKESSIGYTVCPSIFKKISERFYVGFLAQYQNDTEGYSVLSLRVGTKIQL